MSRWVLRKRPETEAPIDWARELDITPTLLDLLWGRGFCDLEKIRDFLSPRLRNLTTPDNWPQIPNAARLLADELLAGKKLAIWGDYDVDGITATSVVLDVLEEHGFQALYHLPDRRAEGYGLNIPAIEDLAAQGCQTLLTVDCGISNVDAIARARELGMTVILSDHHLPPEILPNASSIVNPRMCEAGHWPCEYLAGVGVAFYLLAAVNIILSKHTGKKYDMAKALDLVALGTMADVMRLVGENRILAKGGLDRMARPERPGLKALKSVSGFDPGAEVSSVQAVFRLAPRINAAGRMGNARVALALLREKDLNAAMELARELDNLNTARKEEEDRIHFEARLQAQELLRKKNYAALVLFGSDWHPGIVGIVASRIVEEFNRPTFVLYEDKDSLKGSGRTAGDFNLYEGLVKNRHLLTGFGGHKQAAGARMPAAMLDAFRDAFSDTVRAEVGDIPPEPVIGLDRELDFRNASDMVFLRELQMLQPFGPGNSEPLFMSPEVVVRRVTRFGKEGNHVRLLLCDEKANITLPVKAWRMADRFPADLENDKIRIAYTTELEMYNGMPSIDITVKDWKRV